MNANKRQKQFIYTYTEEKMKATYWYYKNSDIIGTAEKDQEAKVLRMKKRKAKTLKTQKKISM